jgi:hypothetical protein
MAAAFSNGTRKFFNMSTAPTGWTRDATAYDHAILIAGVGNYTSSTGGVSNFTTVHPSTTMSASASGTFFGSTTSDSALDIPSHTHTGTSNARTNSVFGTTQTGYTVPSSGPRTVPYWRFVSAQNASSFSENDWSDAWPTGSIGMGSLVVGTTYSIAALGTTTAAQWSTVSGGSLSASSKNTAVGDTFVAATTGSGLGTGQVRAQVPGGTHNHNTSVTGTFTNSGTKSFNLGVKYVDLMLASKNGIYGATWASQTSSTVVKGNFVSFTWNTPTTTIPVGSTIYYTIQNIGYTGALSSTARSGSFVTTGATFTQSITITDNSVWDNGGSFMIQIRSDSIDGTIMARSQVVTITEPNPTVLFGVLPTPITEGTSGTFTFTTTRLKNGEILTYTVNNTTTSNADFSSLTGSVIVAGNAGTFTITPTIDLLVESAETFTVSLKTSSGLTFTSGSISITNVTPTVTFTITPTTLSVNTAGTFTITTTNVPNGTPLTWEIGGGNDFQGTYVNSTGTVYIYNNTGTFYITPNSVRDIFKAFQVSTWNFTVRIKNSTGQTLQTSALVTVDNSTVTFITPTTSFDQGQTIRYNITTTNIQNGTQLVWKIAHGIGNDACFSAVQGYVTIDNNTGSFTISATSNNTFAGSAWTTHTIDIYDFAGTFKLTGSGVGVTPVTSGTGVIKVNQTYPAVTCKFITPPLSISEGTAATLEFESNISSGTLYWTINNITSSNTDFTVSVVSGTVALNGSTVIDSTVLNQRYRQTLTITSAALDIITEPTETFTVSLRTNSITGTVVGTSEIISIRNSTTDVIQGQVDFVTASTTTWTVPPKVTSICAVAIGGGGAGANGSTTSAGSGGGGGALAYVNNITVTPGETLTVVVGAGGVAASSLAGTSSIARGATVLVSAGAGGSGVINSTTSANGGTVNVGTGGNGGRGGGSQASGLSGGGGGAGGYTGDGGGGGGASGGFTAGSNGNGGGGGGGGGSNSTSVSPAGGGGTSIFGQGSNGNGGNAGIGGSGGSGGSAGLTGVTSNGLPISGSGGTYGGGGGGGRRTASSTSSGGNGFRGAVRIIWGIGRAFPSSGTQNM